MIVTPKDYNPFKSIYTVANGRKCKTEYGDTFYTFVLSELALGGIKAENEKEEAFLIEELFNMGII